MRQRKLDRCEKRQRGQFLTPTSLARQIVRSLDLGGVKRVLEPSCGDGSFIRAIMDSFTDRRSASDGAFTDEPPVSLVGVEIDENLLAAARAALPSQPEMRTLGLSCDLLQADFFRSFLERKAAACNGGGGGLLRRSFDLIVGNPPFGGSFDPEIEDTLDALLGRRLGCKIKKETYAFFTIACIELLRPGGRLVFICSDSMLTISTMTGLRNYLMHSGIVTLHELKEFSEETTYPMLVLDYIHERGNGEVHRFGQELKRTDIEATPNLSWGITPEIAKVFRGPLLGDLFVASSGMTTGKNEFFVREISPENTVEELYDFRFREAPVTVVYELERARLNKLSPRKIAELAEAARRGDTDRRVAVERRGNPVTVRLPHPDYLPYNKANGRIVYSPPTHAIYWKDDGDAVLTYKRKGNWYLRGVGGQPFFGREAITWQLVASRFVPRYLPPGYILDSGAPCAFVLDETPRSELHFVIGWLLSPLANRILKSVINHTRNIQSKDFERMPYPWWVLPKVKARAIETVERLISSAQAGRRWARTDPEIVHLTAMYELGDSVQDDVPTISANRRERRSAQVSQQSLFTYNVR